MPRFTWPEPDLEGLLSDWNASDRENVVSCLSAFELDELEDRLTPSSGEEPQDLSRERADLLREQKLLLEHNGRAARQRRKLEQRAESLATLVRRAHEQRAELCAALKTMGGVAPVVSSQPSVALASALSPRQPPPPSGVFGFSARRSTTASPAFAGHRRKLEEDSKDVGKACSHSPGRSKSWRRLKGATPPPGPDASSDEPEAELFDSDSRDAGLTSAPPPYKAQGRTLPAPPSPHKEVDSAPAWVAPMKMLGSLPLPPDSLKAAATCAAAKGGFPGGQRHSDLPGPLACSLPAPPCSLPAPPKCSEYPLSVDAPAGSPKVPMLIGLGAGVTGSLPPALSVTGPVPPPLAFASKVFAEKNDHSSNSCPSVASVSTGVSTRSGSHPGTSSSHSAPSTSHSGPSTPPRSSAAERSKSTSVAAHPVSGGLRWPGPAVTPARSEERSRSAPSPGQQKITAGTHADAAAGAMPVPSSFASSASRGIPTWPGSWLREEERQEPVSRTPAFAGVAAAAASQRHADSRRSSASTSASGVAGERRSSVSASPMAPRLSTAVSPPPSPVLSGSRNIRAVGSPPPSPGSSGRNSRPVGSPPPSPKDLPAPPVGRRYSIGSGPGPVLSGRSQQGSRQSFGSSSGYSCSPGRHSISSSPMRGGGAAAASPVKGRGSSGHAGHHSQGRAGSVAASAGAQRQSSPAASSPSPRTAARLRRYDRENWARRGVTGASPPPRVLCPPGSDLTPGAAEAQGGSLHVIVRCRPVLSTEPGARAAARAVRVTNTTGLEVCETGAGTLSRHFSVDAAFGEEAKTGNVFSTLRGLARAAAGGVSSAVVAYGPTGSGKTHTMYGDARDPGIVPRAAAELLTCSGGQPVQLSMIELHNDSLVDLLATPGQPAPPLEVRGGSGGAMATIEGAREVEGSSVSSLLVAIQSGLSRRQVAATNVNAASSRSHLIVVFGVRCTGGRLTLVDLAGVERVKRSGAQGGVLREAQSINRSLQSIGDVVDALRKGAAHIPVRNSRLSRLISGALGGGAETAVVVCLATEAENRDEAVNALCFAERVRRIPMAVPSDNCSSTSHAAAESRRHGSVRPVPLQRRDF
mmetsp:Transcript_134931/g.248076  ORF Transcript_134931/g.248076 Transcript_134931/m.248076 type:complete len:1091 (-) Transcript_134931:43-3315(-)